jgi:hypothetical protein
MAREFRRIYHIQSRNRDDRETPHVSAKFCGRPSNLLKLAEKA